MCGMNRYAEAPVLGAIPLVTTLVIAIGSFGVVHLSRSGANLLAVGMLSALVWAAYELTVRVSLRTVARSLPLLIVMAWMFTFAALCATILYSWLADVWW